MIYFLMFYIAHQGNDILNQMLPCSRQGNLFNLIFVKILAQIMPSEMIIITNPNTFSVK